MRMLYCYDSPLSCCKCFKSITPNFYNAIIQGASDLFTGAYMWHRCCLSVIQTPIIFISNTFWIRAHCGNRAKIVFAMVETTRGWKTGKRGKFWSPDTKDFLFKTIFFILLSFVGRSTTVLFTAISPTKGFTYILQCKWSASSTIFHQTKLRKSKE